MFRSIWSKSLRDYRVAILSWGIGLALLMVVGFVTATPVVLAGFASLASLLRFLGEPYAMQTPEGYITFRYQASSIDELKDASSQDCLRNDVMPDYWQR